MGRTEQQLGERVRGPQRTRYLTLHAGIGGMRRRGISRGIETILLIQELGLFSIDRPFCESVNLTDLQLR